MSNKIEIKDCCLIVNGREIQCEDDLVRLAASLSTGNIPNYIEDLELDEQELANLEQTLANEIFILGKCLTPDEDYLKE
jgi:hypothetical protein|tara:strand:- start:2213 stop:2449 length:237 start_codon:yes stop_codon:yes gene_type:complete